VTEAERPRRRVLPVTPRPKPRCGEISARRYELTLPGRISALFDALRGGGMEASIREGLALIAEDLAEAGFGATPERIAFRRAAEARAAGTVTEFDREAPFAGLLVRFLGSRRELAALGAEVAAQAGDIFVVWVNLVGLVRVLEHPATVRAEPGRTWQAAATAVEVARAHHLPPHGKAASGLTGRGTRIGVVDTFIDLLHPDLRDGRGATRLAWLHDHGLPPRPGPGRSRIGARFEREEIDAAIAAWEARREADGALAHLARARDLPRAPSAAGERRVLQTHGTAVAGIAAGAGRLEGRTLPGIAPEAELAFVAAADQDERRFGNEAAMLAGVADLFETATPLHRVAGVVVNLSNGDNLGPHDGSLLGEEFLDALLLLPGRALVVAAGNEHLLRFQGIPALPMPAHARAPGNGAARDVELALEFAPGCLFGETAEIWFSADGPGAVTIAAELGTRSAGPVTVREPDGLIGVFVSPPFQPAGFSALARLSPEPGGQWCLTLTLTPTPDTTLPRGKWRFTVHGAVGDVHAWVDRNNRMLRRWFGPAGEDGIASGTTLNVPSTARRVLAVASLDAAPEGTALRVSDFSGRGPSRAPGVPKPELAAIGAFVTAPSMRGLIVGAAPVMSAGGTSFAAPQVAGAAALYCERIHAITGLAPAAADIRQALCESARRDGLALPAAPPPDAQGWDPAAGFGALDIGAMVAATMAGPARGADLWLQRNEADTGLEPLVSEDLCFSPAIALLDGAGRAVEAIAPGSGPLTVRVRYGNRGDRPAREAMLRLWAGPACLRATPPVAGRHDAFVQIGERPLDEVPPGAETEALLTWRVPNPATPLLVATLDSPDDPLSADEPMPARNNVAVRSYAMARIAAAGTRLAVAVTGSDEDDGLIVRAIGAATLRLVLPAAALPFHRAALYEGPWGTHERPYAGAADDADDPVRLLHERIEGAAEVTLVTEALGADRLRLAQGRAVLEGRDAIVLPRLRVAAGARIRLAVRATGGAGAITALLLSGGRRAAACTVRLATGQSR
jgi:subtilisin family serine protease